MGVRPVIRSHHVGMTWRGALSNDRAIPSEGAKIMPNTKKNLQGKAKVLIVEDDLDIANVYSTKFELEGFDVFVAADGEEGLKKAKNWHPDMVLLDLMLPKIDGFTVLAALKENPQTRLIPVIVWTNLSQAEEARKAKDLGAVDYLVKVYNLPAEVVSKVKGHLNL